MFRLSLAFLITSVFSSQVFAENVCVDHTPVTRKSSASFASDTVDMLGKIPAQVRWNKVRGAKYYLLSISRTKNFKKARTFKRRTTSMPLMVYPDTKYYWKVTPYNRKGIALSKDALKRPHQFTTQYTGEENLPSIWLTLYRYYKQRAGVEDEIRYVEVESEAGPMEFAASENDSDYKESPEYKNLPQCRGVASIDADTQTSTGITNSPNWLKGSRLWLTTEAGFLNFKQEHTIFPDVEAQGLLFPSIGINYQTRRFGRFSGRFFLNQVIGDFSVDTAGVALLDKDFNWLFFGAEAQGLVTTFNVGRFSTDLIVYAGAEKFKTPYFSSISPTLIAVQDINVVSGHLGVRLEATSGSRWRYFGDLRYAQPLTTSSDQLTDASFDSSTLIDIKLGANYDVSDGFFTGAQFKGVSNTMTDSLSGTQSSSGDRTTTYMAIEVMAGFSF